MTTLGGCIKDDEEIDMVAVLAKPVKVTEEMLAWAMS